MNISYFAVYDKKTETYGQLFPSQTMGSAERSFRESVNNPDTQYAKYPEDFSLFHMLEFDDESGQILQEPSKPSLVCQALALVKQST